MSGAVSLSRPPGRVTRGLPFDRYLALDSVHFSTLKAIDVSALHYARAKSHARGDTAALRLGRVLHSMLLDAKPAGLAIYEGRTKRGKAWEAFRGEHRDVTILRREELTRAAAMRAAVLAHPVARGLLAEGEGEVTIEWSTLGYPCRGRVDWLRPDGQMIEIKTTRTIEPRAFQRDLGRRLYHAQIAWYYGGLSACGVESQLLPHVIAVENEPPHDVAVYRVGHDTLEAGARKIVEWMRRLDECRRSGRWPGVGEQVIDLRLPEWVLEDVDVDLGGVSDG